MPTVKGTWVVDYVKMINGHLKKNMGLKKLADQEEKQRIFAQFNKQLPITERLTADDWEIMSSMILPSAKYDYEIFQRIGNATFKVVAQSNKDLVRLFGRGFMNSLLATYKNLLVIGDPGASLKKFCNFHGQYFDEVKSKAELISASSNQAIVELNLTGEDNHYPDSATAFAYQLGGSFETMVALSLGKETPEEANIELNIKEDGDGKYTYTISW